MPRARSGRVLVVAALVAGLGALLLWYAGRDPSRDEPASAGRTTATLEPGATLNGPVLEGLPDGRERPELAQQPWILEVRVHGLPADARPPLKVNVMPVWSRGDREDYEIHVLEDETPGWTEFDVTDVVGAHPHRLRVHAEPRDAFPGTTLVEFPTNEEVRKRGGRLVAEITVTSTAILEGRVVDSAGKPVKGAYVGADSVEAPVDDPQAPPDPFPTIPAARAEPRLRQSIALTDENGRFVVLAEGVPQVVLVAGRTEGGAPTVSMPMALELGTRKDVGDLVLGRKKTLRGRVVGAEGLPGPRAQVRAIRLGAQRALFEQLLRTEAGAVDSPVRGGVDDQGNFALDGIDDGPWLVDVEWLAWDAAVLGQEVRQRARALVRGSDVPVELDVRSARLRVHLSIEGGPPAEGLVLIEGDDALALCTRGEVDVALLPETSYRVLAWSWYHGLERRTVTLGRSGSSEAVFVSLPAAATPMPPELASYADKKDPTLRVSVEGGTATRLPARLRLLDSRGEPVPTLWMESDGSTNWILTRETCTWHEVGLMTRLAPGDYTLEVEADHHRTRRVPVRIGAGGPDAGWIEVRMVPR